VLVLIRVLTWISAQHRATPRICVVTLQKRPPPMWPKNPVAPWTNILMILYPFCSSIGKIRKDFSGVVESIAVQRMYHATASPPRCAPHRGREPPRDIGMEDIGQFSIQDTTDATHGGQFHRSNTRHSTFAIA
jgi:hypothetical protein